MKERYKIDTLRKRIKWEDPKLVKLNKAEQADGNDYGMTQVDPPELQ